MDETRGHRSNQRKVKFEEDVRKALVARAVTEPNSIPLGSRAELNQMVDIPIAAINIKAEVERPTVHVRTGSGVSVCGEEEARALGIHFIHHLFHLIHHPVHLHLVHLIHHLIHHIHLWVWVGPFSPHSPCSPHEPHSPPTHFHSHLTRVSLISLSQLNETTVVVSHLVGQVS
eukprot:GHVN01064639.1.p1 GENE.GHVN01064639.1~~GHVN01064639.1.p1  ORF type:complete len:173 (-),score=35.92 GHVN01064639.1:251-769(-)